MANGSDLVEMAIEAHGGLELWKSISQIDMHYSAGGFAFRSRLKRGWRHCRAHIDTSTPRSSISPYPCSGKRGVFEATGVRIETESGEIERTRTNCRESFDRLSRRIFWDDLDLLYFGGYAIWNYACAPFMFERPGFEVREAEPWDEQGQLWRRLEVTFPAGFPTHSRQQTFYFDREGLIRRLDYTAEAFGSWAKAAHYCDGHRSFSGLVVPTERKVFPRRANGKPRSRPTLVWIEIDEVEIH